jgi:hypothetical protein
MLLDDNVAGLTAVCESVMQKYVTRQVKSLVGRTAMSLTLHVPK